MRTVVTFSRPLRRPARPAPPRPSFPPRPSVPTGEPAPSERITVGMIGVGRQAKFYNLPQFLRDARRADRGRLRRRCLAAGQRQAAGRGSATPRAQPSGSYKGCDAYVDFHEVLARKDIDAVMISTPDHWHVPMALAAMEAGKDVSLEKPITRSIAEGRKLADAAQRLRPRVPRRQRVALLSSTSCRRPNWSATAGSARSTRSRWACRAATSAARRSPRCRCRRSWTTSAGRVPPRGPRTPRTASTSRRPTSGPAGCGTCTTATA